MTILLEKMRPLVDETTRKLNIKQFDMDPIAGKHLSKVVSIMSSAYKRHANIIIRSIFEQLQSYNKFEIWEEPKFYINERAKKFVERIVDYPERVFDHDYKSSEDDVRDYLKLSPNDSAGKKLLLELLKLKNR